MNAISLVLHEKRFLEDALADSLADIDDPRDRAFAHALAATALRRKGQIEAVLENYIEQKLRVRTGKAPVILLCGVTQLLFMETEPHAAISTSVALAARDEKAQRLKGLINAVLRNISRDRDAIMASLPETAANLPKWLNTRLRADYGAETTALMADAHAQQADIDLTIKNDTPDDELLALGVRLPTGTVRLNNPHPAIPDLPGFGDGNWWVQDAAASLPVLLLGDINGKTRWTCAVHRVARHCNCAQQAQTSLPWMHPSFVLERSPRISPARNSKPLALPWMRSSLSPSSFMT